MALFPPADLPTSPVDLVINCLDCPENAFLRDQPWYKALRSELENITVRVK